MQLVQLLQSILIKESLFKILLFFILLVSGLLFMMNVGDTAGDDATYLNYIKGFQQGRYTYWYFLDNYVPDTFRNPGYPFFLYVTSLFGTSILSVKIIQFLLFLTTIGIMLKIVNHYDKSTILKNIFLLLVLVNFVVLSYSPLIFPETLMMFLITLLLYIELTTVHYTWKKIILLVLLYGFAFQVRPVIIFIPFIRCLYYLFIRKIYIQKNLVFIILFVLSTLPYGFWNLKNHQTFKITPLEGGAGAMYLGYWSPKMLNYVEDRYWRNVMYQDVLVNFTSMEDVPKNVERFNNELDSIESICNKYLNAKDSANIAIMKTHPKLFVTYNSAYTIEKEKIINKLAIQHYTNDWLYTVKLKAFTFFRLWYTGWSLRGQVYNNPRVLISTILAFLTTFITLLFFIAYLVYVAWKKRNLLYTLALPLLLCLYFDLLHLPFVIQSRYTIPVRMLYLFALAYMIFKTHFFKYSTNESHKNI